MARALGLGLAHLDGTAAQVADLLSHGDALRALRRALLAVDALPQVVLKSRQHARAADAVAAVALETIGLVHSRRRQVRSVVISQFAALRDAAAAKNAIGGLGDEVEVLGRLQMVMAALMRAHPTLHLFHLVEHGKCDTLQIFHVRLTALVTLGNAACRRNDIFFKIMAVLNVAMLNAILIGETIPHVEARQPYGVHTKILHQSLTE